VPVYFGTNRKPLQVEEGTASFANDRDESASPVHLGIALVNIPKSHVFGQTGQGWLHRILTGTNDEISVVKIDLLQQEEFIESLSTQIGIKENSAQTILLYIHGYRNSFEDACIRAAQIGWDLKHQGPIAIFSWPSRNSIFSYWGDEATIEASYAYIRGFVRMLLEQTGAQRINIIAHSMGNRALADLIEKDSAALAGGRIGQIILAAPDMDKDRFQEVAKLYPLISKRTTLYVSHRDLVVRISEFLHAGFARVGYAPPVTTAAYMDTVDVTQIDLDGLGHGYIADAEPVLYDMKALLDFDQPPNERTRLQRSTDGKYWVIH
jgi:esterase/lipase superfamily enzyme